MPDVRDKLQAQGTEPVGGSPADLQQFQHNEIQKWTQVARSARVAL
jgi:tripartite-type tricarboxylate transporter receptor subunit TctC